MLGRLRNLVAHVGAHKENEFDTARPGSQRPLVGLFRQLDEKKKQKLLTYKGAEYCGGAWKKLRR